MIHEGTLHIERRDAQLVFIDQRGRPIPVVPPCAANGRELEDVDLFLQEAGLHIDASTNEPRWDGAPMDLGDTLTWMLMAHSVQ